MCIPLKIIQLGYHLSLIYQYVSRILLSRKNTLYLLILLSFQSMAPTGLAGLRAHAVQVVGPVSSRFFLTPSLPRVPTSLSQASSSNSLSTLALPFSAQRELAPSLRSLPPTRRTPLLVLSSPLRACYLPCLEIPTLPRLSAHHSPMMPPHARFLPRSYAPGPRRCDSNRAKFASTFTHAMYV